MTTPVVGIVAVQGAFVEHAARLEALNARPIELRRAADAKRSLDGLVLPGGESTTQEKLMRDLGMIGPLCAQLKAGLPALGTCAGLVLLAERIRKNDGSERRGMFGTMPITVARNGFGRQLASFHDIGTIASTEEWGLDDNLQGANVPLTFIRAPRMIAVGPGARVLVRWQNEPVAVAFDRQIACTFHPELDPDLRLHRLFLHQMDSPKGHAQ